MKLFIKLHKHNIFWIIFASTLALILMLKLQFNELAQFGVLFSLVLFYLIWALGYHLEDKTLRLEIMIEYILIAVLALIFFYGILL